ncbi:MULTISPECIES: DEAD/DEAH box helicase [Bacillus]|uniref:RNA polymerase-associated protein RapA n=1 Tax=Bacillus paranthracis TaxID=2026186 RepID=A0A9X8SLM5_9BACI|nr:MULTISPECIES: helicase-related protein [Bacillus cereus group]ONG79350.1 helicase [Bacillus cereus]MCH5438462.1 DEAD/DEAH box helicase [Bacillus paranthracis]MDA1986271.1 helicase-related protein [Bacillus cereus group sp. BcHK104]MDX6044484.1 helicase-related protein [Bacillus paranthracis]SME36440.1 RNA polymerase-associated protein RapA [Bacillus paranthracis]
MMKVGEIVSSTQFPESVEIKRCEAFGEYFIIEAIGQETNKYYEIMLEQEKIRDFKHLKQEKEVANLKALDVQRYIQYILLKNEVKFSKTRALGNKNLLPLPHQIEAVYGKMLQVPHVRFLLADDPGAGKTIMSGMLIKELKARLSVERILVLVPPLVLKQWQEELEQKFDEHFHIINRAVLKEYGGKNPFISNRLCLTSMYWAMRDDVKALIQEAQFDLVIVDEAHKMAAYTHGTVKKKTFRTKLYQLGESILRKTNHCLLLTATPHKGDSENFRHLMKLIDEDIFSSSKTTESLKEKTNPFIIRRLKENLKNFDGTPLFPKRTTKTIQFNLTDEELALYDAVTEYVREYFNRAMNNGSNSTAFAMMLLQRRLSSSIDAIYLSLKRRYSRLIKLYKQTEAERNKYIKKMKNLETENYLEEGSDIQEKIELQLEKSIDVIDTKELKKELIVLKKLIQQAENIKLYVVEKKYQELEETLFGASGLLNHDEKILIFTESVDTLSYLEEKLLKRVPKIAKIIGSLSMEQRRKQVEMFRNECQIMIATDAGGESINLQFCNQMINYDIPWNPNKLEQRMGRIHRIGQKNEVFVFNLVAQNTREGSVMTKLLDKMELMKSDLGSDLVYDFMGDILEEHYDSLADLMQQAIIKREHLDEVIAGMEKTLSEEHQKLLALMKEERMTEDNVDLTNLKREKNDLTVQLIPKRTFTDLATYVLEKKRVRIFKSQDGKVMRIERLPKFIRDYIPELQDYQGDSYRFTNSIEFEEAELPMIAESHPLFNATLELMKKEVEGRTWHCYTVTAHVPENLYVEIYHVSIVDGTGEELENHYIHLARRENGEFITLDQSWIFANDFINNGFYIETDATSQCMSEVMKQSIIVRDNILTKREKQLNKLVTFLEKTFNQQYRETLERLETYQQENLDNRNSVLINQMNAQLIDLDIKKEERLNVIYRQKNISMKPPKKIISMKLMPNGVCDRVIAKDYYEAVMSYERENGRLNIKMYNNLGLVDYYSERFNGEERYIILTENEQYAPSDFYVEDLNDILEKVYVYVVKDGVVVEERAMNAVVARKNFSDI